MSWLSKQLKRTTKILDPVGNQLRKSTGGSYGDPMNWYNSKPNVNQPWQPSPPTGLGAPPNGQNTLATTQLGGDSGGRTYAPNPFQNPMPQRSTPGLTAPTGGKYGALPAGPMKPPSMGFGGPQLGGVIGPLMQQQQQNPQMQNQMLQAQMLRSGGRVM